MIKKENNIEEFYAKVNKNILAEGNAFINENKSSEKNYDVYKKALSLEGKIIEVIAESISEFDKKIGEEYIEILSNHMENDVVKLNKITQLFKKHENLHRDEDAEKIYEVLEKIIEQNKIN